MRTVGGILLGALTLFGDPGDLILDLRLADGRPVAEDVYVNGAGPFTFLIDTGSQLNMISEEIAERLEWLPTFAVELVSLEGVALHGGFVASQVSLGGADAQKQRFLIAPEAEMARVARGVDGVLGQAFLSEVDYRLDLGRRKLTLGEAEVKGVRVPFELSHGRMMVETNQGWLVLDSGADAVILRRPVARPGNGGRLDTVTGPVRVQTALIDLTMGKRLFRDVMAAFVPGEKENAAEPDGLLPLSLLGSIYVSNSGGYVVVGGR